MAICLGYYKSYSQAKNGEITYLYRVPVRKGYIYKFTDNLNRFKDPSSSINVFSKRNKVFAITDGKIKNILKIADSKYIFVKGNNCDSIFVYGNLEESLLDSGANVKKGDLIGRLKKNFTKQYYVLTFSIMYDDSKFLNYIEIYDFLLLSNKNLSK